MTHVTCMLTAKNRDQLRNPTLGNRVWATFTFLGAICCYIYCMQHGVHVPMSLCLSVCWLRPCVKPTKTDKLVGPRRCTLAPSGEYDSNNSGKCIAVRKVATLLRELTCHMGSHSVTCHPAEVTFPPLPQLKLVLD